MPNIISRFLPSPPHPLFFASLAYPAATLRSISPFRPSSGSAPRTSEQTDIHFYRVFPGDTPAISLERHIHYVCGALALSAGITVLNVGSGTGDIAIELARFADVRVIGVDENLAKVQCATRKAQEAGLASKVSFIHAPANAPLDTLSHAPFDAIIAIESLKAASHFDAAYRPLAQLLRPGGKLGVIDWCWSSTFDASNTNHQRLASLVEGAAHLPARLPTGRSIHAACAALASAGLRVTHSEDLAARSDRTPWYAPLERLLTDDRAWSGGGEDAACPAFGGISRGAASVLVQAGRWKLFTPIALFVAEKPA